MKTIQSGETIVQDPSASLVYLLDWDDENLDAGVILSDAGVITITTPIDGSPSLQSDSLTLLEGGRTVSVRLTGGVLGRKYRVAHRITTNESPEQVKEQSFYLLIQNR